MSEKKSDRIKIYIVIGLALVMVVLCYFRFIHKKATPDKGHTPFTRPVARLDVPAPETKNLKNDYWYKRSMDESLRTLKRDIFAPLKFLKETENWSVASRSPKPASTLKLRGTIVGGGNPIAIINDQFVRIGDWIDEYKLVKIGKKEVLLASGNKKIKVEMLKNE